jgi:mono/diheme cytochrome c family protein
MKKILKYLLFGLLGIVVLAGGMALFISLRGVPTYDVKKVDLHVEVTPERVAHGRMIVTSLCAGCHQNPTTQQLTGREMTDVPQFGKVYSRNITQDREKGIGKWTDGEIAHLLRTGIKPSGSFVPFMAGLRHMSDEDLNSIIAFLHSDDPLVRASNVDDYDSDYSFLTKFLCLVAIKPAPYPTETIVAPDPSDKVAFGRYLVTARLTCYDCHSADFKTVDFQEPENSEGYLGGGNEMVDASGRKIYTANITFDPETGIGNWTLEQFRRALHDGFRPDNTPLRYPMERYAALSDQEIDAIYAYLQSVPHLHNPRKQPETLVADADGAPGATASESHTGSADGKAIYHKYACYACHGDDGLGICDLRGADRKYATNDSLISWIRNPSLVVPDSKMPTWDGVIKEEEYVPLAEYVRELGRNAQNPPVAAK